MQICPAFNVLSAGPLPGAEARFARALGEPLSLHNQSYSLLTLFWLSFGQVLYSHALDCPLVELDGPAWPSFLYQNPWIKPLYTASSVQ